MSTGLVTNTRGRLVPLTNTLKRTKTLTNSTITVTGNNGWTITHLSAIFYSDSSGTWWMDFNLRGGHTGTAQTTYTITVAGVTFANLTGGQALYCYVDNGSTYMTDIQYAVTDVNNSLIVVGATTAFKNTWIGGAVKLASEPTTYTTSGNMEVVSDVTAYIPDASASNAGLMGLTAQSFIGIKNFQDGIKLGNNETIIMYDETTLSGVVAGLSGTPAVTGKAIRIGNVVTVNIDWVNPTTVTGAVSIAAGFLPTGFRPAAAVGVMASGVSSGAYTSFTLAVAANGGIEVFLAAGSGNLVSNAGWYRTLTFSFVI